MSFEKIKSSRKRTTTRPSSNIPGSNSAQGYWALANSFSTAADLLLSSTSGQIFIPTLYLLGHSLELHFKAFLILKGVPEKKLGYEFGHDLVVCLGRCKQLGMCNYLPLSYSQIRQIVRVNRYYQGKQLEYFYTDAKQFGAIESFRNIVSQTSKALFTPITESDFSALSGITT